MKFRGTIGKDLRFNRLWIFSYEDFRRKTPFLFPQANKTGNQTRQTMRRDVSGSQNERQNPEIADCAATCVQRLGREVTGVR